MGHLPEQRLLDVLEGAGGADRVHVDACPQCQAHLADARAGLALALGAEMPEPSPRYWPSLRSQVRRRLDEGGARRPAFWRRFYVGPALATAALLAGIVTFLPVSHEAPAPLPAPPLAAWSALPPADEDPGLDVLRAVAPEVAEASPAAGCAAIAECMADLSEEETLALAESLQREIGEGKRL